AHARGIVHRDIKPANVMVGRYGEVTVMDWGIARVNGARDAAAAPGADAAAASSPFKTREGALIGTPAYMSPEQARGEAVDARSDVYSLSVMFFEMLTLTHYLDGRATLEAVLDGVKSVSPPFASFVASPHQARVPTELAHFLGKGLQKDPKDRFASVEEMIERLRRRAEGSFPIQCPVTFTKRTTALWTRFVDDHPAFMFVMPVLVPLALLAGVVLAVLRLVR
ncbi:MAG TPA: serine/threonine-protein kinase, partial [Minicystis sp.]|nr:serine/threonine-protein kinase [Minicystis sp.]